MPSTTNFFHISVAILSITPFTTTMARSKKANGKLGTPDHFLGFKLAFLISKAALYQQAIDTKAIAEFYNKVTKDFIAKYGREDPFNKEPAEDPPDPVDFLEGNVDGNAQAPLLNEEAEEYSAIFTKL
jgi:hypothetical protein